MTFSGRLQRFFQARTHRSAAEKIAWTRFLDAHPAIPSESAVDFGESFQTASDFKAADLDALNAVPLSDREAFLAFLLTRLPVQPKSGTHTDTAFRIACAALSTKADALLSAEDLRRRDRARIMNSGAGLILALGILLLFVASALFLKVVFFGFLFAYLFLPVEKFLERHVFETAPMRLLNRIVYSCFKPARLLRSAISRHTGFFQPPPSDPTAQKRAERASITAKASVLTICLIIALIFSVVVFALHLLVPFMIDSGRSVKTWANENQTLLKFEKRVTDFMRTRRMLPSQQPVEPGQPRVKASDTELRDWLQAKLRSYVSHNGSMLASFAFTKSRNLVGDLITFTGMAGTFAFDLLMCLFFFYVFLQKMAMISIPADGEKADSIGTWTVKGLLDSGWFPAMSGAARDAAAEILDRIYGMFNAWLRGYTWIICTEVFLYMALFSLFSVPYAIPLACVASCAILLPCLGVLLGITLSVGITLAFAESGAAVALTGVAIAFLCINGILEQLVLYPTLVGGAIGLTLVETIIVVLIGAVAAGILGMILAVPIAALIKYLAPILYRSIRLHLESSPDKHPDDNSAVR